MQTPRPMPDATQAASPYADLDVALLTRVYAQGPERLRRALQGLDEADLQAHLVPGKWSIQELIVHLADAEIMGAVRIRQAYAEPGTRFSVYDQERWADQMAYQQFDRPRMDTALRLFELLRATTHPFFNNATEADWQKTGYHPERGMITLRDLLELYADHSERHLAQILYRRDLLGNPLDLPLLLEARLY